VADESLIDRLKARGEEMFTQVSGQLMQNPQFVKAMQGAMKGKQALDEAASRALKQMNIPTRSEFKKAVTRIESLERELTELRAAKAARRKAGKPAGKRGKRSAKGAHTAGK
jgi:polyhydroxyalkanoate synthesis regulator phasin